MSSSRNLTRSILLLVFFVFVLNLPCFPQGRAVTMKHGTWFLESTADIKIPPPPGDEKTKSELQSLKQISAPDQKQLQAIKYWDAGSPSYRWNQLATALISFYDFVTFSRAPSAWMNMAVYDATNLAFKTKEQYKRKRPSATDASFKPVIDAPATWSYPCEHSVTAAAAAHVLAYFYPAKADSIMMLAKQASRSRVDGGVQYPSDMESGWELGKQVASKIIAEAKKDGSDKPWTGSMKNDPSLWRGEYPVGITAAGFRPLVMRSGDQFRPAPPPDFDSEMKEMKEFKQDFRSTYLAYRWAALSGYDIWTDIASQKMFEYRIMDDALLSSRIYTLLHLAAHEATIAIMDAKYAYWGIRPFQYDSTYKPLIATPPFPGYPSGHATASSTACTVLEYFFPVDAGYFQNTAMECAESRFYGGIHFRTDNSTGLEMGKKIGNYVVKTMLEKK